MPTLRLVRDSGYRDYFRGYRVLLDGTKILELRNGQTQEIPVSAGQHCLSVRIDWCGSGALQFSATEGETVTIHVKSNIRGWRIFLGFWYVLFAWNSYLVLERIRDSESGQSGSGQASITPEKRMA